MNMRGLRINLNTTITMIAIAMVIYHMLSTRYMIVGPTEHQNVHLAFSLVLVFLSRMQKSSKLWLLKLSLLFLSLVATAYIQINYNALLTREGFPTTPDIIIGIILIIVVLESVRGTFGMIMPLVGLLAVLFTLFGSIFPGVLSGMQYSVGKVIGRFTMGSGIYGSVLGISANYLILFIVFGAVMQTSGTSVFFFKFGRLVGGRLRSGPALTAVTGSGLMGMLTGAVTANVATVGPYTIPLMKKVGYTNIQAGAIEATASTGGQIMPPVMGAAAFIMSGVTGIPYAKLCIAAAIPAILYYFGLGMYAQLEAIKANISPTSEKITLKDFKEMIQTSHLFCVPIGILVVLFALGYSPMFVIFWTILSLVVLGQFTVKNPPSLQQWIEGFASGAKSGAEIGVVCALLGLIISSLSITGVGIMLPSLVGVLGGGHLIIVLIITMIVALILGCGMPTSGVYVFVVVMAAPLLIDMGIPTLQAHLFIFYYACLSFVTPPVAMGALVASRLAGGDFVKTGIEATKSAAGGFIIPFLMLLCPALLFQFKGQSTLEIILGLVASIGSLVTFQMVICGCYLTKTGLIERSALLVIGTGTFVAYLITKSYLMFILGVAFFVLETIWQLKTRRKLSEKNYLVSTH